jgi:hypothetical protein
MRKINMAHVPYRGAAPALVDLLGGHVAREIYLKLEMANTPARP